MQRREFLLATAGLYWAGQSAALAAGADTPAIAGPIVATRYGKLQGRTRNGVNIWKGIAYGADTSGSNRFLPPQRPATWRGVRDAGSYGHPAPQVYRSPTTFAYPAWVDAETQSEDCLCLNVWAPTMPASGPRPVMVWFHGGGYSRGSGGLPIYEGSHLAQQGEVVVVTVNHRLNIFGYAHVAKGADERFASAGNAGQLDLIAALEWVRDNIAGFGGDAGNVTIFGESGGGAKVSTLLGMPGAKGLFHKAIVQSGASTEVLATEQGDGVAERVFAHFSLKLGEVAKLQKVPTAALHDCFLQLTGAQFAPVLDGKAIPQQTWTPAAPPYAHAIPLLVGNTTDETAAFIDKVMLEPIPDEAALLAKLQRYGGRRLTQAEQAMALVTLYRAQMPGLTRTQLLVRITTDLGMWRNSLTLAERQHAAGGAPAYLYEFAWTTPCFGSEWALHALDIPFTFGNHDIGKSWDEQDSQALRDAADPEGRYRILGEQMIAMWTTFARTGNPSIAAVGDWPAYTPEHRHTLVLDGQPHLAKALREGVRAAIMAV